MSIWRTLGREHWVAWVLLGCWLHTAGSAAESSVRVPPWFSHSAVLPRISDPQPGTILLSGDALSGLNVRIGVSIWPEEKLKPDDEPRGSARAERTGWTLKRGSLQEKQLVALQQGGRFDITLQPMRGGREQDGRLVITNLCFGPVWLLFVDPSHDDHDLPSLTEDARRRVRVLALSNGLDPFGSNRWVTAAEAADRGEPLLCGQPRDFANRLVRSRPESTEPIGLILVPNRDLPATARSIALNEISRATTECPVGKYGDYHAGLAAAVDVTSKDESGSAKHRANVFGASQRRNLLDLKREGILGPSLPTLHLWKHISSCKDMPKELPVTGRIW